MSEEAVPEKDRWKYRRRATVFTIALMSSLVVGLICWGDPDNGLHTTALDDVIWGLIATVGFYIGAPVADDWLQTRKARNA